MRIGLDGFPLTSPRTGVGHYTFELARALALMAPTDQFELIAPTPFHDSVVEDTRLNRLPNLRLVNPKTTALGRRRWWAVGLPLYIKKAQLDLFHGTNYEVPLWNKRRSVLTIHDLSILLHPEQHEELLVRRARRRLPVMIRSASMIITPTESVKREVCENLKVNSEKIVVTPEAPRRRLQPMESAEADKIRHRLGVEDRFILFVGTIEPRKNLITLARAFEQVLQKTKHRPQLVIAGGEGWLTDEFFSFVKRSAISDRLRMTGYLHDEDLRALYSSCRAFVYPSIYEGFGLPPLEAMACGAPVIASNIPTFRETLGDAACLVDPQDADALANSIIEVLEDENGRRALSAAGLQQARKFSWERTAQHSFEAYEEILRASAG